MHCQNAGRRWNFSSSNIAGSVWGWTVYKLAWTFSSNSRFQFSISTGQITMVLPNFFYAFFAWF